MKNKGYFGESSKSKKLFKKILISLLVILLIFVPSFLIAFNYFSSKNSETSVEEEITITIYDNEVLLFSETATKQNALPDSLVAIFDSLLKGITKQSPSHHDLTSLKPLLVTQTTKGVTSHYTCYFFTDGSDENFLIDGKGQHYKIASTDALLFLTSAYSEILYSSATPPQMYTSSNDKVTPLSARWYYKNASQKFSKSKEIEVTSTTSTYDMAGALGIKFDIEPDDCLVDIYNSGINIHSSSGTDFSKITVPAGTVLNFRITATWEESEASEFYGVVTYNFNAVLGDRADFTLNKTELYGGDFLLVECTNILDLNKIEFAASPNINFAPRYYTANNIVYALIPFDATLESGVYALSFTYGASVKTVNVTVHTPTTNESTVPYEKNAYFLNYISNNSLSDFSSILNFKNYTLPEYLYLNGSFLNYAEDGATEKYLFNTRFTDADNTLEYTLYGTVFEFEGHTGTPIKAANNGKVINCGYSKHIGNFVVIEHGLGLRTIYGHLSAVNVKNGDIVLKGESIGRSGKINGYDNDCFLLATYIFDVAVDYSNLSGNKIPFSVASIVTEDIS